MKLAGQLSGGRMRAATLNAAQAGASAYAADMENGGTRIVVINKDASSGLALRIESRSGMRIWRLEAPGLTATSGVTLAGAPMDAAHPWKARREERIASHGGFVDVEVSAASAAVLFSGGRLA
jgi:hypothetical protein